MDFPRACPWSRAKCTLTPFTREHRAYPAAPDTESGWENLFSERLHIMFARNRGSQSRVGRYHNVYGHKGTWDGGREKAQAARCRKADQADEGGSIDIWGDGLQTQSVLLIDDCVEVTVRLTRSEDFCGRVNIGSDGDN